MIVLVNLLINTYVREIHFHDNKWKFAPCEKKLLYSNKFVDSYSDFLNRAKTLSQRLLGRSYVQPFLLSSHQKLYGRHHDIIERYEVLVSQMRINILRFYVSFTMWRVLYTEQDMLTHPKQLMSLPVFMTEANKYGKRSAWFLHLVSNTYMCVKMFISIKRNKCTSQLLFIAFIFIVWKFNKVLILSQR